jgi:hypothetical protein
MVRTTLEVSMCNLAYLLSLLVVRKLRFSDWKKTDVLATAHTDSVAVICERSFKEGIRKIA